MVDKWNGGIDGLSGGGGVQGQGPLLLQPHQPHTSTSLPRSATAANARTCHAGSEPSAGSVSPSDPWWEMEEGAMVNERKGELLPAGGGSIAANEGVGGERSIPVLVLVAVGGWRGVEERIGGGQGVEI
jgi:hypothetical protein